MKTAIYIEDGVTQLVLTPENDYERSCLDVLGDGEQSARMMKGSFYECTGGWWRQSSEFGSHYSGYDRKSDASLMIRVSKAATPTGNEP